MPAQSSLTHSGMLLPMVLLPLIENTVSLQNRFATKAKTRMSWKTARRSFVQVVVVTNLYSLTWKRRVTSRSARQNSLSVVGGCSKELGDILKAEF